MFASRPALFLVLAAVLASHAAGADRPAVPPADAVTKAEAVVRDLFKDEFAKAKTKAAVRQAFAEQLLKQAGETKDDAATRYVLLREARDMAAKAGDADLAGVAAAELAAQFKISPGEALAPAADPLVAGATTPVALQAAAEVLMTGAEAAEAAEDWASAASLYKGAAVAAGKAKMPALAAEARDNAKNIDLTRAESARAKEALKTLADKPADPAANLAVGRFLCVFKGNWKDGVGHLAKGSDAKLAAAAAADVAAAAGGEAEQVAAADAWYDLAAAADPASKSAIRGRAHHWYTAAAATLTGLPKVRATKRADELKADADARSGDWKFWAAMRQAAKGKALKKWPLVGGAFSKTEFEEVPEGGAILIGLRYTTINKGEYPGAVQPIYLTARGEVLGKAYGVSEKGSVTQTTKAKPGYAIGALYTRGGGGFDAIKPIYMRIDGTGLNTKDAYDGPHIGGKGGGDGTAGGTGEFIVGLHGKVTNDLRIGTLGPVTLEGAADPKPKR